MFRPKHPIYLLYISIIFTFLSFVHSQTHKTNFIERIDLFLFVPSPFVQDFSSTGTTESARILLPQQTANRNFVEFLNIY